MDGRLTTNDDVDVTCDAYTEKLIVELSTGKFWTERGGIELACRGIARILELQLETRDVVERMEGSR